VDTKRNSQYILRAKYILLTYSQVDEDVFHPEALVTLIHNWDGKCRIGREFHQDGGVHYHAFCVKENRFVTRDKRKFDIAGFHPNITPVMRTPHKAWAYAIKDGDVVHDDIPEAPVGRSGKAKKPRNEVWTFRLQESKSADDALNALVQDDTRGTLCAFNNVKKGLEWYFRQPSYPEYTPPSGLRYEFDAYPEIYGWQQRYFGEHPPAEVDTNTHPGTASSESISLYSGSGGSVDWASSSTEGTSIDCLFGDEWDIPRYDPIPPVNGIKLKQGQHRVKSLVVVGPSRLGKSLVARSFGRHNYFQGEWNVELFNPEAEYNVFDDIEKGLDGFNFRAFLGCQSDVNVTDKYHKKAQIKNGKPCIYLHNIDPLQTRTGQKYSDWLRANCTFVYINTPICNLARLSLEEDIIRSAPF
jgi:hypothetical protein